MQLDFEFFFFSISMGIALAMDAFSVSLANGLNEPKMDKLKMCGVAGTFSFFQALMPMLGWICIHTVVQYFHSFEKFIPFIALALLGFIGGKMLIEGIKSKDSDDQKPPVGFWGLVIQGVATSIDALSEGLTISAYSLPCALLSALIIAAETFVICLAGILIGRKFGTKLAGKAGILGGSILIFIGITIFIKGII